MEEKNKDIEQREDIPQFVHRDGMLADKEYVEWVADVKHRYRQSQVKASVRVNTTMLEFYWSVGPIVFGHVPWKHHVQIFCNCESLEEAFFYINKVATEGWSRSYISVAGSCRSYYCRDRM